MKKLSFSVPLKSSLRISTPLALVALLCAPMEAPAAPTPDRINRPASNPASIQLVASAKAAIKRRNVTLAIALLKNALNAAPRDGEARALLGWALLQSGDAASAERELRQARRDRAPEQLALSTLFEAMLAQHEEKKLLDEFPEPAATAHDSHAADLLLGRALALQALGRGVEAATSMDRSLWLRRDVSGLLARARLAARQNNSALERNLTDEALKLDPNSGQALQAKLNILRLANDTTGALALSEKILRLYPYNIPAALTRIEIFLKLNQDGKAKAENDAILAKLPRALNAVFYKALLLARANDAKAAWRVAQTIPLDFVRARPPLAVQVAQMAIRMGNVETGAAILATTLAKSPDQLDVRLRLAAVRMSQNSPHAALGVLLPIKDSRDPHALALLAQVYEKVGRMNEAGSALDTLGSIKLRAKDPKGALEPLTHAHSLLPSDGEISFHLVQALAGSGNRSSASGLLRALLDSGVEFEDLAAARQLAKAWH